MGMPHMQLQHVVIVVSNVVSSRIIAAIATILQMHAINSIPIPSTMPRTHKQGGIGSIACAHVWIGT